MSTAQVGSETIDHAPVGEDEYGYDPSTVKPESEQPKEIEYFSGESDDESPPAPDAAPEGEEPGKEEEKPSALSRDDWSDYGLTEDEAKVLDAKGDLGTVIEALNRRVIAAARADMALPDGQPPDSPAPKPDQQLPAESKTPVDGPFKIELDPEVYDEHLVGQLGGMVGKLNEEFSRVKQMEESLQGVLAFVQSQSQEAFLNRMDSFFSSLGAEYEPLVGKGTFRDLTPESPVIKARDQVCRAMAAIAEVHRRSKLPMPSEQSLQKQALQMVFADHSQELARKQVEQKVRNAQGQFAAKPTHREGRPMSRREAAERFAENYYKSHGM